MALKINIWNSTLRSIGLLLLVLATLLPHPVSASGLDDATPPDLNSFVSSVRNGDANTLRGAYADKVFAIPVVQQPAHNAGFVSNDPNSLTQFSLAAQSGNVGLLAHNTLSGQFFSQLAVGQKIQLVYGDGRISNFRVTHIYRYQAVSPFSMDSDFIDLDTHEHLTASNLFNKVYKGPRHLTLQTCITNNGSTSWGRLFVIAEPDDALALANAAE